jgi:hypothetical protein
VLTMAARPKGQVRIESCRWGGGGGAMGYRSAVGPCASAVSPPGGRRGTGHRRRQGSGGDMVRKKPVARYASPNAMVCNYLHTRPFKII